MGISYLLQIKPLFQGAFFIPPLTIQRPFIYKVQIQFFLIAVYMFSANLFVNGKGGIFEVMA